MKKKILAILVTIILLFTGCNNKQNKINEIYKENIYIPLSRDVTLFSESIDDFETRVGKMKSGNKNMEETSLKLFRTNLQTISTNIDNIKPIEEFSDEQSQVFNEMINDFKNSIESYDEAASIMIGIYVIGSTPNELKKYNDNYDLAQKYWDFFKKNYKKINEDFDIKENFEDNSNNESKTSSNDSLKKDDIAVEYIEGAKETSGKISQIMKDISSYIVNNSSKIGTNEFSQNIATLSADLNVVLSDIRKLEPPEEFSEIHDDYLEAANLYQTVTDDLPDAARNNNTKKIQEIADNINKGTAFIRSATEKLNLLNIEEK